MTNGSVAPSTRRVYNSTWKKWTVFMQTSHHHPTDDQINCKDISSHQLLKAMKVAVARLPYTPRIRLPCIYSIVLHIIDQNTQHGSTTAELTLAVGVAMAYHLCLRASEYASRTEIPDPESHQFDSKSVKFKFFNTNVLIPSSSLRSTTWQDLEVICFTIQHAKNIKKGHGVPIWFSTQDPNEDAVAFLQLIYLWACTSNRQPYDPFLSYRLYR